LIPKSFKTPRCLKRLLLAILGPTVGALSRGLRGGNLIKHMSKTVLIAIPVLLVGGTKVQTLNLVSVLAQAGAQLMVSFACPPACPLSLASRRGDRHFGGSA